jgi:hypothetical protein
MISFKLALQLKEAGFILRECPRERWNGENIVKLDGVMYFAPTLEELIESCGDGLKRIEKLDPNLWECGVIQQIDYDDSDIDTDKPYGEGSTPSEAVAMLYLGLKKHGNN